jgi:conjugal transfer mating pair stabilization protein TraG
MNFEFVAYLNADIIIQYLNTIAAICDSPDYRMLLKSLALLTILGAFAKILWNPKIMPFSLSVIGIVFVAQVVLLPVNVTVINRMAIGGGTVVQNQVVSGVPFGLAAPISIINKIGDWLTRTYETAFTDLDPSVTVQTAGYGFYSTALRTILSENIGDNYTLSMNLRQFFNSCVLPDMAGDPTMLQNFIRSTDKWNEMVHPPTSGGNPYSNPARFVRVFDTNNTAQPSQTLQCSRDGAPNASGTAYALINSQLNTYLASREHELAQWLNSSLPDTVDKDTLFDTQVQSITSHLTNNTLSTRALLRNAMLNNVYISELASKGSPTESAAAMASVQQKKQTWAQSFNSKRMIPLIKNVLFSLIIALIPILIILILTKGDAFFSTFLFLVKILFALELFGPLGAVANHFQTYYMANQTTLLGLPSIGNYGRFWEVTTYQENMGAVIWLMIPALAWLITTGTGSLASAIGGMLAPSSSSASEAASQTTNMSGSVGTSSDYAPFGNQTQFANQVNFRNADGSTNTIAGGVMRRSGGSIAMNQSLARANSYRQSASNQEAFARRYDTLAQESFSAAGETMKSSSFSKGLSSSQETSFSERNQTDRGSDYARNKETKDSHSSGNEQSYKNQANLGINGTIGGGGGINLDTTTGSGKEDQTSMKKKPKPIGVEGGVKLQGGGSATSSLGEKLKTESAVADALKAGDHVKAARLAAQDERFMSQLRNGTDEQKAVAAKLAKATSYSEQANASRQEAKEWSEMAAQEERRAFSVSVDAGSLPQNAAQMEAASREIANTGNTRNTMNNLSSQHSVDQPESTSTELNNRLSGRGQTLKGEYESASQAIEAEQKTAIQNVDQSNQQEVNKASAAYKKEVPTTSQTVQNVKKTMEQDQSKIEKMSGFVHEEVMDKKDEVKKETDSENSQVANVARTARNAASGVKLSHKDEE